MKNSFAHIYWAERMQAIRVEVSTHRRNFCVHHVDLIALPTWHSILLLSPALAAVVAVVVV